MSISKNQWDDIQEVALKGGKWGWTWPKTWAKCQRAWLNAEPNLDGGTYPKGWEDPSDDDDAKSHAQDAWHEGRRIAGRPHVTLVD